MSPKNRSLFVPQSQREVEAVRKQATAIEARIAKSASGYVQVKRFDKHEREAILLLLAEKRLEEIQSPLGKAYRVRKKE